MEREPHDSKKSRKADANRQTAKSSNQKVAADTARYEALAREHGADLSEEGFNEALRKVGRAK